MSALFQLGDEIEWGTGGRRERGRVVYDGALGVRSYDDLGRLQDTAKIIPPDARLTSGTDLLAELVPDRYHLLADEADACRCGGLDRDGVHLRPLDGAELHHVVGRRSRDEWDKLVGGTTVELDATDRSRPLADRQLPEGSADLASGARLCAECFRLAVLDACYSEEPGRRSEEDLREFVLAWMDRRIFSHRHCPQPNHIHLVFVCLALAPPMPEDYAEKVGLIYEHIDRAGSRCINGNPMFFSHRLMHVDDWKRVRPVIEAEEARRENLVL